MVHTSYATPVGYPQQPIVINLGQPLENKQDETKGSELPLGVRAWKPVYVGLELFAHGLAAYHHPEYYITGLVAGAVIPRLTSGSWDHLKDLPTRINDDAADFANAGFVLKTLTASSKIFGLYAANNAYSWDCDTNASGSCSVGYGSLYSIALAANRAGGFV